MKDLRFPIGKFQLSGPLSTAMRSAAVEGIGAAPKRLRRVVDDLSDKQLDEPYRSGGWTARQVIHHLPDSHLNAYLRLKLALTEDEPTIRTYEEARWAELADSFGPVEISLELLEALHRRWVWLYRELTEDQWSRRFRHPDLGWMRVDELAGFYDWHGRHHIAHIAALRERRGW